MRSTANDPVKKHRQDLLHPNSPKVLAFSVESLWKASTHPYVLDKLKTCLKPVLLTAAAVYLAGLVLFLPVQLLALLLELFSGGRVSSNRVAEHGQSWIRSTVSLVPFLALLLMRNVIRKPLSKCFVHLLREVNPPLAASVEAPHAAKGGASGQRKRTLDTMRKVALLIGLELVLHVARKSPILGRLAVAATHFLTMKQALGRDRAIVLSLFGLVPYVEPWLLRFVQLWRSSSLLGAEIISEYTHACVPAAERARFHKQHDVDIPLFALPGSLLLQTPVVGPLFFIPVQASAAFLVNMLATGLIGFPGPSLSTVGKGRDAASGVSQTLPRGPAPGIHMEKS